MDVRNLLGMGLANAFSPLCTLYIQLLIPLIRYSKKSLIRYLILIYFNFFMVVCVRARAHTHAQKKEIYRSLLAQG